MAIMDFINRQFIDVIEWVDDSRDTLSYRFPDDDKQIKNEAQLIVRESQVAQFVYVGQFADTLGPGRHTLKTENIPILSDLLGWKYKFQTPFKADVYYVTTRVFTGNKWGTSNPVMMRDADFGVVRVRAFGTYDFKIVDPVRFLKEVAGHRPSVPLGRVQRRHALAHRQCLQRNPGPREGAGPGRGYPIQRTGCCPPRSDQPGHAREIRPGADGLRGGERVGPAGAGAGDRQARRDDRHRQPQITDCP